MFYLGFKGRLGRAKFWLFNLFWIGLFMCGLVFMIEVFPIASHSVPRTLAVLMSIALYYIQLSLMIRRLHDMGKSGWWFVLYCLVPSIYFAFLPMIPEYGASIVVTLVFAFVAFGGLVNAGFAPGTKGPNKYDVETAPVAA
ncbi:protein containing DUF805 [Pseudovibrio sp. FO-BEG1]|uniref:DUF805 domain-containing protein n=1 Tax=Pseudovibrio sp. (strain FO-BEG1) TaxID=911045 RepID=UPI000238CA6F|nr:DUF805 domain-containing protein [Pseudovibrio sp. FO-BEG1]AEV39124.1 protein containing DUF805 [Pseudovibrio sp. FO-BEG1]